AGMHAALASRPDAPGFPSRVARADELEAWAASAQRQLAAALAVVDDPAKARLTALEPRIRAGLGAIGETKAARVSRIHGDYHLGQLLRTDGGFMVIDFE